MQKLTTRIKQDRSLSLDIANVLSPLNNNLASLVGSDIKIQTIRRMTPQINVNPQETLRNVLGEHLFNSQNNSPTNGSTSKSRKSSVSYHPNQIPMSNMSKPRSSSRTGKKPGDQSLNSSQYKDKEREKENNENDFSLNDAIQRAYLLQAEKEKQFKDAKAEVEQDLAHLRTKIRDLDGNIRAHREGVNHKQINLISMLKEINETLRKFKSGERDRYGSVNQERDVIEQVKGVRKEIIKEERIHLFQNIEADDKELEKKELYKMLISMDSDLSQDLKVLERILSEREMMQNINQVDPLNFRSIVNTTEESLNCLMKEKNVVIHKMYDLEDKLKQATETKGMVVEDINSHIVSMTECVVLQEEMEHVLDSIRSKNPQYYKTILQEVELHDKLIQLGFEKKKKQDHLEELINRRNKDEKDLSELLQHAQQALIEVENVKDLEMVKKEGLIKCQTSLYEKFKEGLKGMNSQPQIKEEHVTQLDDYFKIFCIEGQSNQEYEMRIFDYHMQVMQEMQIVLQTRQDIENLENTLLQIHLGTKRTGAPSFRGSSLSKPGTPMKPEYVPICDKTAVTKSIQDEIINKKLKLAEKTVEFSFAKEKVINGCGEGSFLYKVLKEHSNKSIFEITKKLATFLERPIYTKLLSMMVNLVNTAKMQMDAYKQLDQTVTPKNDKLKRLNAQIQEMKKKISMGDNMIQQEIIKLKTMGEEEGLFRSHYQLLEESYQHLVENETRKEFQSYMQEHQKHLKKIKFQYGRNFMAKFTDSLIDNYINTNTSTLEIFKTEIQEVHRMVLRMEEYRAKASYKLENELKPALNSIKTQIAEYQNRLNELNRELHGILEKEDECVKSLNMKLYGNYKTPVESEEKKYMLMSNTYMSIQIYKSQISDLVRDIIEGIFKLYGQEVRIPTFKVREIKGMIHKLQGEVKCLLENDIHFLSDCENELKNCKHVMGEKETKLVYFENQIQKTKHFYEISDHLLLKNKDESSTNFTSSNQGSAVKSQQQQVLSASKPAAKGQLKSSRSVSKLSINLKENMEPERYPNTLDLVTKRNSNFNTPKITPEPRRMWIQGSGARTNSQSRPQTPNISGFLGNSSNSQQERERSMSKNRNNNSSFGDISLLPITGKQDRVPKCFNLSESQLKMLMKEFEYGIPVKKRLNTSTSGMKPLSGNPKIDKMKEFKGYGVRKLRLNLSLRTLEVLKPNGPVVKPTLEYSYQWKDLKKVFIPPAVLKGLKDQPQVEDENYLETNEILQFSLDIVEKGRIDFLISNPMHLGVIWNVTNQIITQGRVNL